MKRNSNRYWRSLPSGSAEQVIAHAACRRKRGKQPSMSFWGTRNPLNALKEARRLAIERDQAMIEAGERLISLGTLTKKEVEEFIRFEFVQGPDSLEDQVRRYYLMYKRDFGSSPKVREMLDEMKGILKHHRDLEMIEILCIALSKYIGGFLIRFEGKSYTASGGSFRQS